MSEVNFLEALRTGFPQAIPHCRETGITVTELASDYAIAELPYREDWLADPERGMLNPGIVTTLVDSACGIAVIARIGRFDPIATLDLRVDYLRPAFAGASVFCRAECYRMTENIAFVRASVWQRDPAEPVAISQSVFMRGGGGRASKGPL